MLCRHWTTKKLSLTTTGAMTLIHMNFKKLWLFCSALHVLLLELGVPLAALACRLLPPKEVQNKRLKGLRHLMVLGVLVVVSLAIISLTRRNYTTDAAVQECNEHARVEHSRERKE